MKKKTIVKTNPEHYTAFDWCVKNELKLYPKPRNGKYIIVMSNNGVAQTSGKTYDPNEIDQAIWDAYLYLYKKNNV